MQRDETARLKGLKGRLSIKPSGMEKNTKLLCGGRSGKQRRGKVTPRVTVEAEVLRAAHPPDSKFKGHEPCDLQDLVISARAVHDRRERWLTPDGEMIVAPLPGGIGVDGAPAIALLSDIIRRRGQPA